ncbi:LysR substrate-binding domain-containing protein [Magnetospirillum sp. UT-4]|uniref:LysR substrate-binding domain-containing protein n=1 Tax=Magnetospirillum sp. UT-4 TaxID=2681467 RepID=UPI0013818E47|nr:LysR substrate-binding domain-containing protein [Magnetospirillum sp. UT-4]CAA7619623.1 Transcriptional regulator, LysR family [Magnetospirillum sp. UT-4]
MPTPLPPFDFDLLRSFVAVVDCGGFTRAAVRLGRTQSAVSLQIKRLEEALGQRVLSRDRREPELTAAGELLLTYARRLLHLADEARVLLQEPDVGGTVRLGTPEDFATNHLSEVLSRFTRAHPQVTLEVQCDFTANLLESFSRGQYDLVLCKREPQGPGDGVKVWREPLVWAMSDRLRLNEAAPLPLVLAPNPDIYRRRALAALERAGRTWRIIYSSPSFTGIQAAVRGGLGVTVLPREMVTAGLMVIGPEHGLPELADTEIVLLRAPGSTSKAAEMLAEDLIRSLGTPLRDER